MKCYHYSIKYVYMFKQFNVSGLYYEKECISNNNQYNVMLIILQRKQKEHR